MPVAKSYIIQFSRVYTDEARHELELLNTTWLIDEFVSSYYQNLSK